MKVIATLLSGLPLHRRPTPTDYLRLGHLSREQVELAILLMRRRGWQHRRKARRMADRYRHNQDHRLSWYRLITCYPTEET